MLGAIVGDVIGSWYEGNSADNKDFPLFMEISRCTDDSVLTSAVAETVMDKKGEVLPEHFAANMRKWGNTYPNAGYGGTFRRWLEGETAGPNNSWGNGSAMRVSPIGRFYTDMEEVLKIARMSAEVTHGHPEGIKGAQAVALAVFLGRMKNSKAEIKQQISDRFSYDLDRTIEEIRPKYCFEVSCQKSVPEAIIAALQSKCFEDAIRLAISLGGDADTQAAIAGSIAETLYGGIPEKLLSYVLPRLPLDILDTCIRFYEHIDQAEILAILVREKLLRTNDRPDGLYGKYSRYSIILHRSVQQELRSMSESIASGEKNPGAYLSQQLNDLPVGRMKWDGLLRTLLNTKHPCIFAEGAVIGNGTDWTIEELRLLGKISFAVPVTVFDDGRHQAPEIHEKAFKATLLYIPGPLFRSGSEQPPTDWNLVIDENIDKTAYFKAIKTRLLPVLKFASIQANRKKKRALVTVPGIGCGQFAGPFLGTVESLLESAIRSLLEKSSEELSGIDTIWFDPYSRGRDSVESYGDVTLMVRPLRHSRHPVPQLSHPSKFSEPGKDLSECELFSVVAWDHVSWPGNDFWVGSRATDDGVKAAATDSMFAMTGVRGSYKPQYHSYDPPAPYTCWREVVEENQMGIRAVDNIIVVGNRQHI